MKKLILLLAFACSAQDPIGATHSALGELPITDVSTVVAANHPAPVGESGVWYDATHNTFGTPSASGGAMRIDDGGFTNGVYALFSGAIPTTGAYRLQATVHVVESEATETGGIRTYQMGAATGSSAVHRGLGASALAGLGSSADYIGLTPGDDTGAGPQVLATAEFEASAGDDVLVAFGTDVTSGTWSGGAGFWSGAYVIVESIALVPADPTEIVDDDEGAPRFASNAPWSASSGAGFGAGHYHFASTGSDRTATWEAALEPGVWDAQVFYRAGTNRASAAHYVLESDGAARSHRVNQRAGGGTWVDIGQVEVGVSGSARVTLDASASAPLGRVVIADAVRFVPGVAPVPNAPEIRLAVATLFDEVDNVEAITAMVDDIALRRYNAVAVHTRYRGDATYFPNRVDGRYPNGEPRNASVGDVDVLQAFIDAGHARGLAVYAYVNTHLVTDGADEVAAPNHVANLHPEWRTYAYGGGTPHVQTTADDPEGVWMDPALPAVRRHLEDVVGDIATNYDIDGVILDRIRYPQTTFTRPNRDFGYHPDAVRAFNRRYRKTGLPDPYDADWIAFRQDAITQTVGAIHDRLASIDPEMLLLAYPIGRLSDAIGFNYQDWPQWLAGRHIDGVLPQIYTDDLGLFADRVAEHRAAYAGDRLLGVTLDAFRPGVDLAAQIETARALGLDGTSPFRHGTLVSMGVAGQLADAWTGPAPFPATPWKGASIARLNVADACETGDPRRWGVVNPNAWSIEVEWSTLSGESARYFAPPGESSFSAPAHPFLDLAALAWRDHRGRPQVGVALHHDWLCARR